MQRVRVQTCLRSVPEVRGNVGRGGRSAPSPSLAAATRRLPRRLCGSSTIVDGDFTNVACDRFLPLVGTLPTLPARCGRGLRYHRRARARARRGPGARRTRGAQAEAAPARRGRHRQPAPTRPRQPRETRGWLHAALIRHTGGSTHRTRRSSPKLTQVNATVTHHTKLLRISACGCGICKRCVETTQARCRPTNSVDTSQPFTRIRRRRSTRWMRPSCTSFGHPCLNLATAIPSGGHACIASSIRTFSGHRSKTQYLIRARHTSRLHSQDSSCTVNQRSTSSSRALPTTIGSKSCASPDSMRNQMRLTTVHVDRCGFGSRRVVASGGMWVDQSACWPRMIVTSPTIRLARSCEPKAMIPYSSLNSTLRWLSS